MGAKKQREAILAAVCVMRNHPTADEIYEKLKKDFPRLSLGTVYRNLNLFVRNGDIRRILIPGEGDRFDFRLDAHQHLHCSRCGRVYDVNATVDIKLLEDEVQLDSYTLVLHGACGQCK